MSEHSTPEERTEMPTDRRMGQLRKEGVLPVSQELTQTLTLLVGFLMLGMVTPKLFEACRNVFESTFKLIARPEELSYIYLSKIAAGIAEQVAPPVLLLTVIVAVTATLSVMIQTNWNIKEKKIKWQVIHINPLAGIKRMFSLPNYLNVLKALLKLGIFLPIAYFALKQYAPQMVMVIHLQLGQAFSLAQEAMQYIFWKIITVLICISIFDFVYQRWNWLRQYRMTKEEVKDERKAIEGDEATKKTIQRKGLQRIMQRIKQTVPKADVVITNPTHFAVALKYDRESMGAPTVVAKGQDYLALRIREIARESGVPIIERKLLARALYASCEVDSQIPRDLFRAVAEVFAYVFKLKNPHRKTLVVPAGGTTQTSSQL